MGRLPGAFGFDHIEGRYLNRRFITDSKGKPHVHTFVDDGYFELIGMKNLVKGEVRV